MSPPLPPISLSLFRDDHRQPDRVWPAEGRAEGQGDVHVATETSSPNQEVQPAFTG